MIMNLAVAQVFAQKLLEGADILCKSNKRSKEFQNCYLMTEGDKTTAWIQGIINRGCSSDMPW